jgi:alkanesulfonate monooxygenase SsuD/methylene tetrahydromethanopterin reductase-like flavin-dependent oxidoreductase (luciferase family)
MTSAPALRFGMFLSQAGRSWTEVRDDVVQAEELGFDHAWLVDHLVDTDGAPEDGCLEGWTLLAAIAARTERIRLGVLVSSNTFRHPALLLKEAVTVDHISGGRVILGIGTGWHEDEHRRYGIDLPAPAERVDRFEEAVECISLLMGQERTTYAGRYYRLEDARLEPRPVQQPRIPILIAAHRPRMLRIAARYADQWDTFAAIAGTATDGVEAEIADRIAALDDACRAIGRDPAEIRRSTWATSAALRSPEAYLDFIRGHHRLGFTDFSTVRPAAGDEGVLRAVARDIIPELRAGRLLD